MSTDAARLNRLWERMAALYGSRWEIEYGPVFSAAGQLAPLAAIWAESIADLGNDQIANGLRKLLDREAERPPSLPEFLRLCGRRSMPSAPYHAQFPPPADPRRYDSTPAQRCAELAAELERTAQTELYPRLEGLLPEDRKAAVKSYWMAKIARIGGMGTLVTGTWEQAA